MFSNYFVTAWRNLIKNGLFSLINILGLALGLMSCILILLFVQNESGYDTWVKDNDRIVRMHTAYTMPNQPAFLTVRSAGMMMEAIKNYAQNEVEDGVRFIQYGMTIENNGEPFAEQITMVDNSFFNVFDLPFVHGSVDSAFTKPMDLVITKEMAFKYFGRTDVIGETLTFCCVAGAPPTALPITGVIEDLPDATHFDLNFIIYLNPALFGENNGVLDTWTSVNVYTYFKLNPGVELSDFQSRTDYWLNNESPIKKMMLGFIGDSAASMDVTDVLNLRMMPLPQLHLHARKDAGNMGDFTPMGDASMINTFIIVAALVLVIACINFMNLSTAKAGNRAREVAMRKVLGASRTQVAIQFLGEAILIVLVALLVALVGVELVLPLYNQILGKNLELAIFSDFSLLMTLLSSGIAVGVLAGLYPALYLSKFLPGKILRASKSTAAGASSTLRNVLVVFQFATSIVLVISTLVVYGQTMYSNSIDVGYKSEDKLVLNIRAARDNRTSLKQELLRISEISSVTFSSEAPTQDNENNTQFKLVEALNEDVANEAMIINYHNMGYGFFEAYQVTPLTGRLFDESYGSDQLMPLPEGAEDQISNASAVINVSALKKLGFEEPEQAIGKTLASGNRRLAIIGVIPDLHFRSIKFGIRATVYLSSPRRFNVANIAFDTNDLPSLTAKIEEVWKRNVPMQPIDLQFLTQMMEAQYSAELTIAELFLVFSALAIIIACLGLYGLSAFTVERRTKEIGIRKVMGAQVADIVKLLVWQFSKPVFMANIIAWPIAIYAMSVWLEAFPYRIELFWLLPICATVSGLSLVIAWATVGGNAAHVARKKPMNSLRYE